MLHFILVQRIRLNLNLLIFYLHIHQNLARSWGVDNRSKFVMYISTILILLTIILTNNYYDCESLWVCMDVWRFYLLLRKISKKKKLHCCVCCENHYTYNSQNNIFLILREQSRGQQLVSDKKQLHCLAVISLSHVNPLGINLIQTPYLIQTTINLHASYCPQPPEFVSLS